MYITFCSELITWRTWECGLLARVLPDTAACPACWHWTLSLQRRANGTWRPSWSRALAPSAGWRTQITHRLAPITSVAWCWVFECKQQNQAVVRRDWPSPVWRGRVSSGLLLWTAWSACWLGAWVLWLCWELGKACRTKPFVYSVCSNVHLNTGLKKKKQPPWNYAENNHIKVISFYSKVFSWLYELGLKCAQNNVFKVMLNQSFI